MVKPFPSFMPRDFLVGVGCGIGFRMVVYYKVKMQRNVIRDLLQAEAPEEVIKSIIRPEIEEGQVLQKKAMWMEMRRKEAIEE